MTVPESREWLRYAFNAISDSAVGDEDQRSHPDSKVPVEELEQLGVLSPVYWALVHTGHADSTTYSSVLLGQRLLNALKRRESQDICSALELDGLRYRLLKGQSVWLHLYQGREEIRPVSDTDILVHPDDYERAIDIIETLGYFSDSGRQNRTIGKTVNQFTFSQQFGQFVNAIDLHRFPHNWPLHHKLGDLALQSSHGCKIQSLLTLDKPLAILWIACHRAKDRFQGDLREVLDAKLLLHSMSEAEISHTLELSIKLDFEQFVLHLILQARYWFGEASDTSSESNLLANLEQLQPGKADRIRQQLARSASSVPSKTAISKISHSRRMLLLNQYMEPLLTPGHRFDSLRSMAYYAIGRLRTHTVR